jgi:lysophospholipase
MKMLIKGLKYLSIGIALVWLVSFTNLRFENHQYAELSDDQNEAAVAYLKDKLPEVPDAWQWHTFSPEPGVDLRTGVIDYANAKGTIIMVPGYTSFAELTMRTIIKLNNAGYRVALIEYRGQGGSYRPLANPEKGYVESYETLANEVARFAKKWRIQNKPLYFFSTSKGGHITMRMAEQEELDVNAYALVVPMIQFKPGDFDYTTMRRMVTLFDSIGLGDMYAPTQGNWPPENLKFGEATSCNSNPETAQLQSALYATSDPKIRTSGITMHWARKTMASTGHLLKESSIKRITAPVKIFTAGNESFVSSETAQKFCGKLANCSNTHFPKASHCINRENLDRMDEIIRQSLAHFAANDLAS